MRFTPGAHRIFWTEFIAVDAHILDKSATPRKIDLAILGSCVTRDAVNLILDRVNISYFQARTSIGSMMSDPVSMDFDLDEDVPKFELRCVREDFNKSWRNGFQVKSDIFIMDFIDQRFGLGVGSGGYFTYSTPLQRAVKKTPEVLKKFRYFRPNRDEYNNILTEFLPPLCDYLAEIPNIHINDVFWTIEKEDGSFFDEKMQKEADESNRTLELIYNAIKIRTTAKFFGFAEKKLVARVNHRWGDAPFHYSESVDRMIADTILEHAAAALRVNSLPSA
ncbi:DUF6270 domain-containing protein [Humitalea sp. 24SJ18S-53]|uniref:DUF6270 domain-containing protein n=1 Tax=Humitalea sp. 24SJ18S-53 TaxID=3422307 RepID=UPI003D6797B7